MGAAAQFDLLAVLVDGGIDGEFVQVHCWCPFSCWVLEGAGPAPSKRRAGGLARDMGNPPMPGGGQWPDGPGSGRGGETVDLELAAVGIGERKSTRLNSSH